MHRNVIVALLLSSFGMFLCSQTAIGAGWETRTGLNGARDQFAAGLIGDTFYVFGGNGNPNGTNLSSIEIGDTASGSWSYGTSNSQGVEEVSGAVVDNAFFVFGAWGSGSPYGVFNFVEKYDPATGQWASLTPKPTTVSAAPTAVYNGEIFVFGGYYANEASEAELQYTVVEAYNPATDTWRTVTNMPQAYSNFAVAVYQDRAYLIGGFYFQDGQYLPHSGVASYHFTSDTWSTGGPSALPSVRGFSYSNAAPVVGGKVYLVGGMGLINPLAPITESNAGPVADVLIYDIASGAFSQGPSLPAPRDGHAVLLHDGYLYAIGGQTAWTDAGRTASVQRLSLGDADAGGDTAGVYTLSTGLSAKAVLQVSGAPVTLIWKEVGADTTPSGARVVSGYFYADPNDFAYGSPYNPEVFVKVYIDPGGWANIAFNHVTVDDVSIYSAHSYDGTWDQSGSLTMTGRLAEHQYTGVSVQ